ncbi:MAG: hypothetical protein ACKVTZ_19875 [Bacteroidia bacterium]
MDTATIIAQALMYSVPAVVVLIAAKMISDQHLKADEQRKSLAIKAEVLKQQFPLRLGAYERCVLFLERISPQNLLVRCSPVGKSARQYYNEITLEIRSEYEHNLTQQVYMTPHAWAALVAAKEEMLALATEVLGELPPNADGVALANGMVAAIQESEKIPSVAAILVLKGDVNSWFSI